MAILSLPSYPGAIVASRIEVGYAKGATRRDGHDAAGRRTPTNGRSGRLTASPVTSSYTCRLVLLSCTPSLRRAAREVGTIVEPSQATRSALPATATAQGWSVEDALELYNVPAWGSGYFSINAAGHVVVRPDTTAAHEIDLFEVVQGLAERDLSAPVVIRFSDILAHRLRHLHAAFSQAIAENDYQQPLHRGVSDQGQSAAPGGRGGIPLRQGVRLRPGGRLQARAAGCHGDDRGLAGAADHLQWFQGLQLHRGRNPGRPSSGAPSFR